MQELAAVIHRIVFPTDHLQQILLSGDVDFLGPESCDRQGHTIAVFRQTFDVERRIIVALLQPSIIFDQVEKTVETHSRAAIGG